MMLAYSEEMLSSLVWICWFKDDASVKCNGMGDIKDIFGIKITLNFLSLSCG